MQECRKKRREHIFTQKCHDSYHTAFTDFGTMLDYHKYQNTNSIWERTEVKNLRVAPLDKNSALYGNFSQFASGVSEDAVRDTADNLGLAIKLDQYYPLRDTSFKSLTDRAKISGSALPKLNKPDLAYVLIGYFASAADTTADRRQTFLLCYMPVLRREQQTRRSS